MREKMGFSINLGCHFLDENKNQDLKKIKMGRERAYFGEE